MSFEVCDPRAAAGAAHAGAGSGGDAALHAGDPGCVRAHAEEGLAFELNNRLSHLVRNSGDQVCGHTCLMGGGPGCETLLCIDLLVSALPPVIPLL